MKKYKIKKNKKLINQLKPYWKKARNAQSAYWTEIERIERCMSKKIGIPDLEIFHCDGDIVGIGNYERTMSLIQSRELEK